MAVATIEVLVTPAVEGGIDLSNPFRYGWRPVRRVGPDGREIWDREPLTLADVLHPREGDHAAQSDAHERRCRYLADVFEARLAGDPSAVVLHDVLIAWDTPELKPHGPDIAVILGVRERKDWSVFDVAVEGVRPALIVEVTSPETLNIDRTFKLDEYALAGVPLYVIVDTVPRRRLPPVRLLAYVLTPEGYRELPPDEGGRVRLAPVRCWLGIRDNEIVCFDESGQPLGDYRALTVALAAIELQLEAERRARAVAEAEAAQLRAELERLRHAAPEPPTAP